MLRFSTSLLLFLSLVNAGSNGKVQRPLQPDARPTKTTNPTTHLDTIPTFVPFAIENMTNLHFYTHHLITKTLLGSRSYLLLRKAEIEQRTMEIDDLFGDGYECPEWTRNEPWLQTNRRIYFLDERVFDAEPERVPIDDLHELHALQQARLREFSNSQCSECWESDSFIWNTTYRNGSTESQYPKLDIPETYLQYELSKEQIKAEEQELDKMWKAHWEEQDRKILRGEYSVRALKVPDLRNCVKAERMIKEEPANLAS